MTKCYILDDESAAVRLLTSLLEPHSSEISLLGSSTDYKTALKEIKRLDIDLLFLDINLGNKSGFDFLEELKSINFQVVFTTAYTEYALKAFEYNALYYILKPLNPEKLEIILDKIRSTSVSNQQEKLLSAIQEIKKDKADRIALASMERTEYIAINDIEYINGDGSYSSIFLLSKREIISSKPLGYFESLLPKDKFCRIHRKHLVNIDYVIEVERGRSPTIFLKSGVILSVSAGNKDLLNKVLEERVRQ